MPSPDPSTVRLPRPEHQTRFPGHLKAADLERIRQSAYTLPQVVKNTTAATGSCKAPA